jgi:hypothetical protein
MLTFRTAQMSDVHAVFSDLSPISADEVSKDCGTWWKAIPKVAELLTIPDSQTEALVDEAGRALAIFGHYPSTNPKIRTTWFVFSKGFMARGLASTRACERRVKSLRLFYPDVNFHSYTASDHWERTRWFALLDFQYVGTTQDGQHHYILLESGDSGSVERYNPTNPLAS